MFILIQLIDYILLFVAPAVSVGEILTSNSGMAFVKECPKNLTGVQEASERLNCGEDKYGNNRYLCLPNTEKTSLVQFCYNGTIGMQEKGHCLEASDGSLVLQNCRQFAFGCPETHFRSSEFYQYPACQTIDVKRQCYMLNTTCFSCETNSTVNNEEHIHSVAVWQILFGLSFGVILLSRIPFILKVIKYVKRTKTFDLASAERNFSKKSNNIDMLGIRINGIQDSSENGTKSHINYTYPLFRGGKDLCEPISAIEKPGKSGDGLPEELPGKYSPRSEQELENVSVKQKIESLKGHNGVKRRKYRIQETVILEAEFSRKSSKSGRGLSDSSKEFLPSVQ